MSRITTCGALFCAISYGNQALAQQKAEHADTSLANQYIANTSATDTIVGLPPKPVQCRGEIVSDILIDARPPFTPDGLKMISKVVERAMDFHSTTRNTVIRRYLAIQIGDRCTELRRRESERILRAQPYLADALVLAYPDGKGGVILGVTTIDELSLVVGGRVSGNKPFVQMIRFGEANLAGRGIYAAGGWENNEFYRDEWRGRVVHYQFLGRPYQLSAEGTRNSVGGHWEVEASHPFITDLQRVSWRVTTGATDGYRNFVRPDADPAALPFRRVYSDVGGLYAFGPPGTLFLVGGSVSREREFTGMNPVIVSDSGVIQDTSQELISRYGSHRMSRLNLLLGYRNVQLMRVTGFDALAGSQDVRTGLQISTLIGKGFKISEGDEKDYFLSADVYYGSGNPNSFFAFETMTSRRRNLDLNEWDGILASGRGAWYVKPAAKHTLITDLEFSGGWNQRVPFQLSFENRQGGLRGFIKSNLAGGQRMVLRMEDRYQFRPLRQLASLGGAVFMDAGKLWAGDAPYGVNTGVHASIGIGFLAAIPPKSRRLWRIDFAMPLTNRGDAKFEVRFSSTDRTRWFWREPDDIQTSRERSIPTSVYNWP